MQLAKREHRRLTVLAIIALCSSIWHIHVVDRGMPASHADLVPVWVGVRALLKHENPYSEATTKQIQTLYYGRPLTPDDHVNTMGFAYPATTAIVLGFIGPLKWGEARLLFLILLPALTTAGAFAWIRVAQLSLTWQMRLLVVVLCLASWPVAWGIRLQQPTLLVAALLAIGCWLLQRGNAGAAGIVLSASTFKPQLVALLLVWLLLWAVVHRAWRFVISLVGTSAALVYFSCLLLPNWIPPWKSAAVELLSYTHQVPVLETMFGHPLGKLAMVSLGSLSAWVLYSARNCASQSAEFCAAISLCLATTLSLMPTDVPMAYNEVLLIPAVLTLLHPHLRGTYAGSARTIALGLVYWMFLATAAAALLEAAARPRPFFDELPFQIAGLPIGLTLALLPRLWSKPVPNNCETTQLSPNATA